MELAAPFCFEIYMEWFDLFFDAAAFSDYILMYIAAAAGGHRSPGGKGHDKCTRNVWKHGF